MPRDENATHCHHEKVDHRVNVKEDHGVRRAGTTAFLQYVVKQVKKPTTASALQPFDLLQESS
ncbi:MAG: hypothetical protein ACKPKO_40600, partial [Candidatus Fonsibacter sp.]